MAETSSDGDGEDVRSLGVATHLYTEKCVLSRGQSRRCRRVNDNVVVGVRHRVGHPS